MTQRTSVNLRPFAKSPQVNARAIAALKAEESESEKRPLFRRTTTSTRAACIGAHDPQQNRILAGLTADDYARLLPQLELMPMTLGTTLGEVGMPMQYVYFPTSGIVSLLSDTKEGTSVETAVVGCEGLVGITLFMGEGRSQSRAMVKSEGHGYRLSARVLREEFRRGGALQAMLLRYTHALLAQTSQTAVCNRHHSITQQLCRSILLSSDHLATNELRTTQEMIANMLGVRRESVTQAADVLQKEGLITTWRGHIALTNRLGLERRVCECYSVVKKVYDNLTVKDIVLA